jgi:putative membrane protein
MNKLTYRYLQCMTALGLAAYLGERWISGRLSFYINMRYVWLTLLGISGLLIMAIIGLYGLFSMRHGTAESQSETRPGKQKTNLLFIFLLPVIAALLGLSAQVFWTLFILVFVIGLMRVNQLAKDGAQEHHQPADIPSAALILLSIPLILGIFVPAQPLSAASLNTRGMSLSAPSSLEQGAVTTMEIAPDDRTVLDWVKIFNYEQDLSPYLGASANVVGFIYHDPRLENGQFMVGRFIITCCAADAFAIGMAVNWPEGEGLSDNTWVNVKGTVGVLTIDGQKVPVINAQEVITVDAPAQPYLYP